MLEALLQPVVAAATATPVTGPSITVGMPQTCGLGLSENWLLKEAGDRHWQQLARAMGQAPGQLRDLRGRRVYAAFTHVHLRHARLAAVHEDDRLDWHLRWQPVGRAQAYSLHTVRGPAGDVAEIEMLSVFVARERAGDNHSVARAPMPDWHVPTDEALPSQAAACAEAARDIRAGAWHERFADGLRAAASPAPPPWPVRPCPANDFNGAGLLYFASFQALVDRALWHWSPRHAAETTRERQMVFHGNVNIGEALTIEQASETPAGHGRWIWCRVRRAHDGHVIADIATHRA